MPSRKGSTLFPYINNCGCQRPHRDTAFLLFCSSHLRYRGNDVDQSPPLYCRSSICVTAESAHALNGPWQLKHCIGVRWLGSALMVLEQQLPSSLFKGGLFQRGNGRGAVMSTRRREASLFNWALSVDKAYCGMQRFHQPSLKIVRWCMRPSCESHTHAGAGPWCLPSSFGLCVCYSSGLLSDWWILGCR